MNEKVPWGFIRVGTGLVATSSSKERATRHALGEAAIALFASLGVDEVALALVCSAEDPLGALRALKGIPEEKAPEETKVDETAVAFSAETPLVLTTLPETSEAP